MKKSFLIFVMVLISASVYSQGFKVGLKGGLNFPTVEALGVQDGVSVSDTENASGYHAGLFARLRFSKIAVQPEVLYSFQSFDFKLDDALNPGEQFDVTQKLGYLTVPVMVRLYVLSGLNLQVGPQFGFLLNGEQEDNISGAQDITDIKNSLKGSDIGLNFGAGFDLPFGLDIHARYTLGLQDVNDDPDTEASKNSLIQVSIGYALVNLGK